MKRVYLFLVLFDFFFCYMSSPIDTNSLKKDKLSLINNSKTITNTTTTSGGDKASKIVGTVPPIEKGTPGGNKVVPVAPSK